MTGADRIVPGDWLSLGDAWAHVTKCVGSDELAFVELTRALVDGRIEETEERSIGLEDRSLEVRKLPPKFWQTVEFKPLFSQNYISVKPVGERWDRNKHYFVRKRCLERLWPSATSNQSGMSSRNEPPWRKSSTGAKGDYDWEAIVIEAAAYALRKRGKVKSLSELCDHIEEWCGDDAPGETQLKSHLGPLYDEFKKI